VDRALEPAAVQLPAATPAVYLPLPGDTPSGASIRATTSRVRARARVRVRVRVVRVRVRSRIRVRVGVRLRLRLRVRLRVSPHLVEPRSAAAGPRAPCSLALRPPAASPVAAAACA